jgi:hypothetical protein
VSIGRNFLSKIKTRRLFNDDVWTAEVVSFKWNDRAIQLGKQNLTWNYLEKNTRT